MTLRLQRRSSDEEQRPGSVTEGVRKARWMELSAGCRPAWLDDTVRAVSYDIASLVRSRLRE